jgi:hypothetical protein
MTPETYLGYERAEGYKNDIHPDMSFDYTFSGPLSLNSVALSGKWTVKQEYIVSNNPDSKISLNFEATRVYLVISAEEKSLITVFLDGKPLPSSFYTDDMDSQGRIQINAPRKYDILNLHMVYGVHTLTLVVPEGVKLFAFTFGVEP